MLSSTTTQELRPPLQDLEAQALPAPVARVAEFPIPVIPRPRRRTFRWAALIVIALTVGVAVYAWHLITPPPLPAGIVMSNGRLEAVQVDILLATIARSMPQFGLLAFIVYLVLDMLSGNATPLDSMPRWLETIMQASPTTHFVDFSLAILYRGADLAVATAQKYGGARWADLDRIGQDQHQ
jgi:hypothetical protein